MSLNRRQWLATGLKGGAAAAVIGFGALGWRLFETGMFGGDGAPFEAWASYASLPAGNPLSLVGAAILAASPHNTQPWRFEVSPKRIDLYAVAQRNLGSFDSYRREMWLGLGCAVENIVQAAGAKGFAVESLVAAPGDGAGDHAARLELRRTAVAPSHLDSAITSRRTNRADYWPDTPIASQVLERLAALPSSAQTRLILFPATAALGRAYVSGSIDATAWINADVDMSRDSQRWFRDNPRAVALHRDGASIPTSGLDLWVATAGQLLPAPSREANDQYWLDSVRRQAGTAPWFGMLAVRDLYDRRQQIEAGRLWQRAQLELTAAGIASQPMNQMVEVVDRERQLGRPDAMARHLANWTGDDWHATFAFRLGHAAREMPQSARRTLASVSSVPIAQMHRAPEAYA